MEGRTAVHRYLTKRRHVDYVRVTAHACSGMQFIGAGINQKYKIYAPPAPRAFAGQLVVGTKYLHDPQIVKLIKVFLDPRVQPYLRTTTNPQLKDQLTPVSTS
jgi:D-methionine transport system substrate-binding protein